MTVIRYTPPRTGYDRGPALDRLRCTDCGDERDVPATLTVVLTSSGHQCHVAEWPLPEPLVPACLGRPIRPRPQEVPAS
jgi:hypothetical protein